MRLGLVYLSQPSPAMNVFTHGFLLLLLSLASFQASADSLDSCLNKARKMTLVIDQKQSAEYCMHAYAKDLSKSKCYSLVGTHTLLKRPELQENLNSICFYETQEFSDLKSCVAGAERFTLADNRDEAMFECYMQFQSKTSQKQCFDLSRKLILPYRKDHMRRHCQNNY